MIKETLRTFKIKYVSATNTRGSRISIHDLRNNIKISIPYNYNYNNSNDIAIDHLEKIGIIVDYTSEGIKESFLHSKNFETALAK